MATLPSRFLAVLLCALPLGAAAAAAEETPTVTAFATWTLQGVAVRSAPDQVTLVAACRDRSSSMPARIRCWLEG